MAEDKALTPHQRRVSRFRLTVPALKVASIYGLFAALWIIFSDRAIYLIAIDKSMVSVLQTWKGLLFVLITAVLVFMLVQFYFQRQMALIDELRSQQHRLNLILDTIPDGIQENDLEGRITYSNPGHHKILGYPEGALLGQHIWDFQVSASDKKQLREYFFYLVRHRPDPETYVTKHFTKKGEERVLEVNWNYQFDSEKELKGFISVISDITRSHEQQAEILQLAYYDPLTGLPNRFRSLEDLNGLLTDAKQAHHQIAILMLDLDHFKKINDSLGPNIGDLVLKHVVARLKACLSSSELIGRLGGDEFIIIHQRKSSANHLQLLIESVLQLFTKPFMVEGHEMVLSVSMGIAIYPNDGDTASDLLSNADSAMFYAKDSGRNTYSFFTRAMNLDVTRRFAIEEQLQSALERGELSLVYQPQVELKHKRIVAAEALLRWHNPVLGHIPPDEFISIAEQSSLILPIGRFVLEQALQMAARLQLVLPGFRMAINLSPIQFRDDELVESIKTLLNAHQIDAETIEIEITEGVLMSGSSHVRDTLQSLSKMGLKLAMDDFGTGYSSLSYLRNYPFEVLKIDRSFVGDITSKPAEREMINAIIAMSQGLGLRVVAEGVETREQQDFLETVGCDYGQGYFFSKPLSDDDLLLRLRQQTSDSRE